MKKLSKTVKNEAGVTLDIQNPKKHEVAPARNSPALPYMRIYGFKMIALGF